MCSTARRKRVFWWGSLAQAVTHQPRHLSKVFISSHLNRPSPGLKRSAAAVPRDLCRLASGQTPGHLLSFNRCAIRWLLTPQNLVAVLSPINQLPYIFLIFSSSYSTVPFVSCARVVLLPRRAALRVTLFLTNSVSFGGAYRHPPAACHRIVSG